MTPPSPIIIQQEYKAALESFYVHTIEFWCQVAF